MAEDLHNENSDEEKKQNVDPQDDDDFGLPDLEFEELEELDLDLDDDEDDGTEGAEDFDLGDDPAADTPIPESEEVVADAPEASALEEGIDEVEDVLDSAQLISDRLGDGDEDASSDISADIDYDDLLGDSEPVDVESEDSTTEVDEELAELEAIGIDTPADAEASEGGEDLSDISSPDELAALGIVDEEEEPAEVEEESGSLFSVDDGLGEESSDTDVFGEEDFEGGSIFASDDMAAEAAEEEKVEFQAAEDAALPPTYKPYSDDNSKGGLAKIIIFGVLGFTIIGLIFYFVNQGGEDAAKAGKEKAVAKTEKTTKKAESSSASKKAESESESSEGGKEKAVEKEPSSSASNKQKSSSASSSSSSNKKAASSTAKKTTPKKTTPKKTTPKKTTAPPAAASSAPPGEIENVQSSTGRFYVVVGSFIDQDLANDYANELSADGNGVKIIFPYGKSKRYRVSIADFDSGSAAASQIDSYRSNYNPDAWTLKY